MSGLHPDSDRTADIAGGPVRANSRSGRAHSINSSAREISVGGMLRSSALAVFRLIASSIFVGCSTGSSPGVAPSRIRFTKYAARVNDHRSDIPYVKSPPKIAKGE